jgi:hypothetical protein
MDSAGAQALVDRLRQGQEDRIERERKDDQYSYRCRTAYDQLLALQERMRSEGDEALA